MTSSERSFPAIELRWSAAPAEDEVERVLAELDDTHPTAVQEAGSGVRVFFANAAERARAHHLARAIAPDLEVVLLDVPDEQWAERSQAMLTPVRVGRFVVTPPWHADAVIDAGSQRLIVQPSMGFGTGHHPSTRLCLRLLQTLAVAGQPVLDVGTGSGVLAIAAAQLGAAPVVAIDADPDALESTRENIDLNGVSALVDVRLIDLTQDAQVPRQRFKVVLANLTGAMLQREARGLASFVAPGGALIASGFQEDEVDAVVGIFAPMGLTLADRADEERWVGARFLRR